MADYAGECKHGKRSLQCKICEWGFVQVQDKQKREPPEKNNIPEAVKVDEGYKKNAGHKPKLSLLADTAPGLIGVCRILEWGASQKYAPHSWLAIPIKNPAVTPWSTMLESIWRHLLLFMLGEDTDEESGKPHLDHLATVALMMSTFQKTNAGTDDRAKLQGLAAVVRELMYGGQQ